MAEERTTLLNDLTKDLGIGTTGTAIISALWVGGWWNWIPAVLVGCLWVYTSWLERRLPWHGTLYEDLEQLSKGEGSHAKLQQSICRALKNMDWAAQVSTPDQSKRPAGAGRWLRAVFTANRQLDGWLGHTIWSFSVFNRLLQVALLYPVLLLFGVWWWTDVGHIGMVEVLPSLGSDTVAWGWRTGVMVLLLGPIVLARIWPVWVFELWALSIPAIWSFVYTVILFDQSQATVNNAGIGASAASAYAAFGTGAVILLAGYFKVLERKSCNDILNSTDASNIRTVLSLVVVLFIPLLTFTILLRTYPDIEKPWISAISINAIWLFSIGWMPVINALFDWISLGITRELLRRMTRSPVWMWAGVVLDVIAGVVLTLALLWLAFQILHFMQWCGWPVDAQAVRATFIADPFDPQASWLAMLVLTNLLPTLWHLGVSLWGLVDRQFILSTSLRDSLLKLSAFMDEKGNPKPHAKAPGLGALDLLTVYNSLFVHPWLYAGTVVALVCGLWGSYVQALRWTLTWLP
jgi:hypothetical protein